MVLCCFLHRGGNEASCFEAISCLCFLFQGLANPIEFPLDIFHRICSHIHYLFRLCNPCMEKSEKVHNVLVNSIWCWKTSLTNVNSIWSMRGDMLWCKSPSKKRDWTIALHDISTPRQIIWESDTLIVLQMKNIILETDTFMCHVPDLFPTQGPQSCEP